MFVRCLDVFKTVWLIILNVSPRRKPNLVKMAKRPKGVLKSRSEDCNTSSNFLLLAKNVRPENLRKNIKGKRALNECARTAEYLGEAPVKKFLKRDFP